MLKLQEIKSRVLKIQTFLGRTPGKVCFASLSFLHMWNSLENVLPKTNPLLVVILAAHASFSIQLDHSCKKRL